MRIPRHRWIPWGIFAGLLAGLVLVPVGAPQWAVLALAGATALNALFLVGDHLVDSWVRTQRGRETSLPRFVMDEGPGLVGGAGFVAGALAVFLAFRLPLSDDAGNLLLSIAAGLGCLGLVGVMARLMRRSSPRPGRPASPQHEVLERIAPPPWNRDLRDAIAFGRVCGLRLLSPLVQLWLAALVVVALVAGGGGMLLLALVGSWGNLLREDGWATLVGKLLAGLMAMAVALTICSTAVATFRVTWRMRRVGRLKPGEHWRELGLAMEKAGPVASTGYGMAMLAGAGLLTGAVGAAAWAVRDILPAPATAIVAGVAWVVLAWLMLVWPQLYVGPILTHRDAGWARAFQASLDLATLEKRDSLPRALVAALLAASVVGLPAAAALLLAGAEARELLLAVLLGEKTRDETRAALDETARDRPEHLRRFFDLLERGRYLDALNGFQMTLSKDPESIPALEGQSLAYLRMGNPRARESLERWANLAPENPAPMTLLEQLCEGRWDAKGDLFADADARCTQRIGRGV